MDTSFSPVRPSSQWLQYCPHIHLAILAAFLLFWQIVDQTLLLEDCLHVLQHLCLWVWSLVFIVNIMVHTWFQSWPLIIVRGVHLSRLLLRGVVLCWRVLKLCTISLSKPLQIFSILKFLFCVRGILPACGTLRIWRPLNFWVGWVFSGVTGQISNKGGQLKALYLYFCKSFGPDLAISFITCLLCYGLSKAKECSDLGWSARSQG